MDPLVVVVYDRRGEAKQRHRLVQLPMTFGRSLACDVVLDDRQVSAVHARLEADDAGRLILKDAGSRNGLRLGHERVAEVVFPVKRAVLLGSTRIDVVPLTEPVEKTEIRRRSLLDRRRALAPALVFVSALALLNGWLSADDPKLLKLVAEELLPVLLGLSVWALACSVASRIAQGAFRYVGHLTVASLALSAAGFASLVVVPAVGFWTGASPTGLRLASGTSVLIAGAWVVGQHLSRIGSWGLRRCYAIGGLLMLAVGLPTQVARLANEDEFDTALSIPADTLPSTFGVKAATVQDFLSRTESLQQEADELRRKK